MAELTQRALPASPPVAAPWVRAGAQLQQTRQRFADPATRPALLWQALWWPFLVWSDTPAPDLPGMTAPIPTDIGLAGTAVVSGIDRVRRRLWITHGAAAICRAIWLTVMFAALLMLLDVLGGPTFVPRLPLAVGVPLVLAGLALAVLSRPTRMATAQMLDRTFGLQERLGTALDDLGLDVPEPGEHAPVVYLQMADAANAIAALRPNRRLRPAIPVREVVFIVLASLILATLAFLRGLGGGLPELADPRVPRFTPAIERLEAPEPSAAEVAAAEAAPSVQQVIERSDRSLRARRDLQALAEALADHAATRPAAEEIARGDYAAAGEQLRETAVQAGDLSAEAREAMAGDLGAAAEKMQPQTNGLEEATRNAASGLRQDDEQARSGMRDLGDAVEQAGKDVVPQDELASQMRSAQQSESGRSQSSSQPNDSSRNGAFSAPSQFGQSGETSDRSGSQNATQGEQGNQSGGDPGQDASGNATQGSGSESGPANMPGPADQAGAGQNGQAGDGPRSGPEAAGQAGGTDVARAQQGAGAGTGNATEEGAPSASSSANSGTGAGEDPAAPNVSTGTAAEADPSALANASEQVALPTGEGQQGMQTSADGGATQRGSGAGVTAGSGFAVQGDVGEAGPDSNRVPPQHRETVERYFSNGSGE